jgi:hypothetical protein
MLQHGHGAVDANNRKAQKMSSEKKAAVER